MREVVEIALRHVLVFRKNMHDSALLVRINLPARVCADEGSDVNWLVNGARVGRLVVRLPGGAYLVGRSKQVKR